MLPFSDSIQMRLMLVLCHFLWQGAFIAALLAGAVSILRVRSPRLRYLASLLSLLLMAACPVATWCWLSIDEQPDLPASESRSGTTGDSFRATAHPSQSVEVAGNSMQPTAVSDPALQLDVPADSGDLNPSVSGDPKSLLMAPVSGGPQASHIGDKSALDIANNDAAWWQPAAPWIVTAWLIGVALLSLRLMIGTIATWRWRRQLEPLPRGLAVMVDQLCGLLGMRVPRVALSSQVTEAVAMGLLRPLILLPGSWATSIPADMLEGILAHELAHIRRYDLWVNLFQRLLETLFFYHPAVWWLSNRLRTERELCCDDLAVSVTQDHVRYAEMLEHVGRMRLPMRPSPVAVSIANPRHALLERVRHVLRIGVADDARGSSLIAAMLLTVAVVSGALLTSKTMLSADEWSWKKMSQTSLGDDRNHAIFLHNGKQSAFVVVRLDPPGTESSFNGLRSTRSKHGGTIVQKNFTISFNVTRNNHPLESLTINDKSFSLNMGRVLVMGDDYKVIQLPVHEPELVTKENLKLFVQNAVDQARTLAKENEAPPDSVAAEPKAAETEIRSNSPAPATPDAGGAARDVKFAASAEPEKPVLMVGEPIWIHFKVMNQTNTDKRAIVGGDYRNALGRPNSFKVDVFDADGQRVAQPDSGFDMGGLSHAEPLPAKKEAVFKLFLPHWATITKPGKYRMTIGRTLDVVPSEKDGGQDAFAVKPETFTVASETTFTVVPTDEVKFGALIEQLGPKLISENSDDSENADRVLQAIRVPIEWSMRAAAKLDSGEQALLTAHPAERLVVDERAVPWYLEYLAQPRASRKVTALNFLGQCRSEAALEAIVKSFKVTAGDITDTTNQALAESSARGVHHAATHALSMFATNQPEHLRATDILFSMADDPYMPVRLTVLHFCATNKSPKARKIIDTMTTDKDETLATEAKRYQKLLAEADQLQEHLPERLAMDRSIQFLKSQQREDGMWPEQGEATVGGKSALAVLALLQAGVKSDDAVIQKALPKLRQLEAKWVYVVALQTMALCAASPQQDADVIRRNITWLEEAQASRGRATGGWRYQHRKDSNDADGSNTRFAVMALDSARQAKFEVRAETWQRVATYWMTGQLESGGFGYTSGPPPTYSMTLAGIYCLATANRHLPMDDQSATREAAIKKGIQFASQHQQAAPIPHPLYTDHCLKLAGHMFDVHGLGQIDWRSPVVKRLLEGQRQDGAWKGGSSEDELVGTSFALMFLSEQAEGRKSSSNKVSEAKSPIITSPLIASNQEAPLTLTLSSEDGGRGDKTTPSKTAADRAAEKALNLIKLRKDRIAAHDKTEAAKLVGDWKVTMPKGFVFSARIEQKPDGLLKMSNARTFNGIYTWKDQRLEFVATGMERDRNMVEQFEGKFDDPKDVAPRVDRTRDFVWKQQADGSLLLVEEDHSSGAKYVGATFQKAEMRPGETTWADRMFSELRLDFGKVERGAKMTHVIQITNPFRETITIGDISVIRGPFAVMIDRRELRAAEAAELVITVEPKHWVKKQSRKVSVPITCDAKEVSQIVELELQVEIASDEE